jgi:hypothetical protein
MRRPWWSFVDRQPFISLFNQATSSTTAKNENRNEHTKNICTSSETGAHNGLCHSIDFQPRCLSTKSYIYISVRYFRPSSHLFPVRTVYKVETHRPIIDLVNQTKTINILDLGHWELQGMRLEEGNNISSCRIEIREASIKTQSRRPGMSETFNREPAHDGIVVRSGTDGLFKCRIIVRVRDKDIDPESVSQCHQRGGTGRGIC